MIQMKSPDNLPGENPIDVTDTITPTQRFTEELTAIQLNLCSNPNQGTEEKPPIRHTLEPKKSSKKNNITFDKTNVKPKPGL